MGRNFYYNVGQIKYTDAMSKRIDPTTTKTKEITPLTKTEVKEVQKEQEATQTKNPINLEYNATFSTIHKALQNAGFRDEMIPMLFSMLYMESGGFTNKPTTRDHNPGNIMYFKGANRGVYVAANKTNAAHFNNYDQFAKQFYYELSKGANPLGAEDIADFVHRLKLNGYFGKQDETSYLKALRGAMQRLRIISMLKADAEQKIMNPEKKKGLKWWQWTLIGVGGLIVIKTLKK